MISVVPKYLLDGVLTSELHRTLLAAETVLPSTNCFDHGDSLRDEYVTHRILDHLVLFFFLNSRGRFLSTIPNRCFESAKHLPEQEVENRKK